MKQKLIHWLALKLPDYCVFNKQVHIGKIYLFTIPSLCRINPLYDEIIEEKLRIKGYDPHFN